MDAHDHPTADGPPEEHGEPDAEGVPEWADPEVTDRERERALPPLPVRLLEAFVSPGKLTAALAEKPLWLGALLASVGVIGLSMALLPVELFVEAQRQAMLERGQEMPEMPASAVTAMRVVIPTAAMLFTTVLSFVSAFVYTVVFAFVLGDEGRYKQYLAMVTHAWFIAALFGLLVTPLRISTENPQFTVNLGSFFVFLPDGYLLNLFRALDVSAIWSTLVLAQGVNAIDRRRSFGSAAAIGLSIMVAFAAVAAIFMP